MRISRALLRSIVQVCLFLPTHPVLADIDEALLADQVFMQVQATGDPATAYVFYNPEMPQVLLTASDCSELSESCRFGVHYNDATGATEIYSFPAGSFLELSFESSGQLDTGPGCRASRLLRTLTVRDQTTSFGIESTTNLILGNSCPTDGGSFTNLDLAVRNLGSVAFTIVVKWKPPNVTWSEVE